jgi:hypothetical protein
MCLQIRRLYPCFFNHPQLSHKSHPFSRRAPTHLQVLSCTNLLAKDRNGSSGPFVVASVLNNKHNTPVAKRTRNPTYAAKDATFELPIYLSLADRLGVLELVVWDNLERTISARLPCLSMIGLLVLSQRKKDRMHLTMQTIL